MTKVIKTICGLCATNDCGMDVYVEDGAIQKIGGMAESPYSMGTLCPKGLAASQLTTDLKRLLYPLKRVGKRGEGNWERISWDQALDMIAEKLDEIKKTSGAEAVGTLKAAGGGWTSNWFFIQRLMNAFGSPNVATNVNICYGARASSWAWTYGGIPEPDLEHAECILLWAFNPTETYLPNYGRRVIEAKARGAKVIVIDPRFTRTASKADLYVPIRPGTDGALALGLANIIIQDGLYDREFVEKWTSGFDELKKLASEYPPERVEQITGIPRDTIKEVAQTYATIKPAALREGDGIDQLTNASQTARAIQILPALTGNVAKQGGQVLIPNLPWADIALRKVFLEELESKSVSKHILFHKVWSLTYPDLIDAMISSEPYKIRALLVFGFDPLITTAEPQRVYEAFQKVDFIVVCDPYMTASAQLADIVLPIASFLECTRLRLTRYRPRADCQHVSLQNKAIEPLGESKADEQFIIELAKKLGLGALFPWNTVEDQIDDALSPLGCTIEDLRKNPGGKMWTYPPEELYRSYEKSGFNTPTKKVELYSTSLQKFGYDPLPSYIEPMEGPVSTPVLAKEYPLVCNPAIKPVLYTHTQMRTVQLLKEIMPDPWVEINPLKAHELGINDGDMVLLESPRGKIELKAKVTEEAAIPGVVYMPYGWGEPYSGNYPVVNTLAPDTARCPVSSSTSNHAFLCKVKKI
jgi:anaerobic selenocysteine-containing dehydrogenase